MSDKCQLEQTIQSVWKAIQSSPVLLEAASEMRVRTHPPYKEKLAEQLLQEIRRQFALEAKP